MVSVLVCAIVINHGISKRLNTPSVPSQTFTSKQSESVTTDSSVLGSN